MRIFVFISIILSCLRVFSQSFVPDTAINRIVLVDSKSVQNILGKDCWNALIEEDPDNAKVIVFNKGMTEKLELIFIEGNNTNNFSEFRISQIKKGSNSTKHKFLTLNEEHFESAKGIKLGISQKSVESKLGVKLERKQRKSGEVVLFFRKGKDNDRAFRRHYNSAYFGEYIFQNDHLISFSFGFEQL
jgi:hypothetical protein